MVKERSHLDLLRAQVGEGGGEQLRDVPVHERGVVGEGAGAGRGRVPQRRLDDVAVDDVEQVVQDAGVHLEARLVERVCARAAHAPQRCQAQPAVSGHRHPNPQQTGRTRGSVSAALAGTSNLHALLFGSASARHAASCMARVGRTTAVPTACE